MEAKESLRSLALQEVQYERGNGRNASEILQWRFVGVEPAQHPLNVFPA